MKKYITILIAIMMVGVTNSCKDKYLEVTPNGALDATVLATPDGVDALLIGAYSMLDGISDQGTGGWESASSNWVFGSIRGLEANKGTDSGDQPDINPIQTYTENSTNPYLNLRWRALYEGISRCNSTLATLAKAEEAGTVTADEAANFRKQARTLRGWYHYGAWIMWEMVPYVDETTDQSTLTNTEDIRDRVIADLTEGTTLPLDMGQVGRFNGSVAKVLLAKALMQMKGDYAGAKTLLADVAKNGKGPDGHDIGLQPKYGDIFDITNRNGMESIYTVQYSVNDGSAGWNGGWGEVLNFPYKSGASPGGCCGFFIPSQEFVNSFRTTNAGLPLLDNSYNNDPVLNDQGLPAYPDGASYVEDPGNLDPRLDWTVGRRGIPYLDWGDHTGQDWIRDQSYSGPFSPKKQVYKKSQEGVYTEVGNWTSGYTANGYRMIRYADVLLLQAECEIKTGSVGAGMTLIDQVRKRAANEDGFVKEADGKTNAAKYVIGLYNGSITDAATAMKALMMERKLELGMEGHRYFDLQRWGNVIPELQRALAYERVLRSALYSGAAVGPEDKNYPIPQQQIDVSKGLLVQNR